jgi:hypothetical protein
MPGHTVKADQDVGSYFWGWRGWWILLFSFRAVALRIWMGFLLGVSLALFPFGGMDVGAAVVA